MKNKIAAALFAFFLGGFGIHKFYLGENRGGIFRIILTFSIIGAPVSGIMALIDFVKLLIMDDAEFDLRYNSSPVQAPAQVVVTRATPAPVSSEPVIIPSDPVTEHRTQMASLPAGTLFVAKGINGQVTLLEDRVRIERKGALSFVSFGFRGTKEILISEISSIEYRNAGSVLSGYILFLYRGGRDVKSSAFGNDSITNNENAVMFVMGAQASFDTLRGMLDEKMEDRRRPQQVLVQSDQSPLDELKKLAALQDSGVITEAEFEREKARLLAKL